MAIDRRNYRQLVDTTVELANKVSWILNNSFHLYRRQVGCVEIVGRIVDDLKDEQEAYRKMVMETIEKVIAALGTADVDQSLEERLIDGIIYAYQEQVSRILTSRELEMIILDQRRYCDASRRRCRIQRPWHALQAIPPPDLRHSHVPTQQQGTQGPPAGRRSHFSHCCSRCSLT